ncbi:hypothetical protein SKAU_G00073900 [Synaphobranchus kaupii]|uniref:Glypican-1 n=1 Tax=Synaphobranchus kaupii TaxID=118154 RepID=A0A9Q1G7G7_SYNKA|nr:hypothetical protein SKAU_G00073900 [Synaphobranchus kaupii]
MDFPCAFFFCLLAVPVFGDNTSSKPRSCSDVRHFYSGKGFSLSGVPQTEISGEHLRVCSQGYTCCTSAMEESLASMSRREFEALVNEAGRSLQSSLNGQYRNFDGYFLELLNGSERSLQESFLAIYGQLYSQNAHIFQDLYAELRRYHRGPGVNLEEVLNDFWARLLDRLFKVYNPQYAIGDEYLECTAKQTETLRPFGDVPRDLKLKATRGFIAARSFVQGLTVAGDVVFQACGTPRLATTHSSGETKKRASTAVESNTHLTASVKLEKLVSDVTSKLREMQQYWVQLPNALCNDKVTAGASNEDKCWNGMGRARYLPEVMGDGLASQINNPEVEIDITKPDMTIRQQIMQLKIMTNRLKNAFNGNDVDFQDATDDVSGSGSGMCADELCARSPRVIIPSTDRPKVYAYPAENKKVKSTGSRIHPCIALLLLSLATLSLWR